MANFEVFRQGNFIRHKPLISEECHWKKRRKCKNCAQLKSLEEIHGNKRHKYYILQQTTNVQKSFLIFHFIDFVERNFDLLRYLNISKHKQQISVASVFFSKRCRKNPEKILLFSLIHPCKKKYILHCDLKS